jgi:2-amino-4-hydroxy-6-hydroxymethyldihydropteridine diphosphokinase
MTKLAFISIGSNIDPELHLPIAVQRLSEIGTVIAVSMVYQNPAIGSTPQPDFLNAAALLETDMQPHAIRDHLRKIEADSGRVRTEDKYSPRTLDLDLGMLGDLVYQDDLLTIPDPDIVTHAHLAVPFADLAPDHLHPVSGETLQTIADRLRPRVELSPRPDVADCLEL